MTIETTELVVFDEVAATITEYKTENEKLVFDYADPDGAKQARSHIAKLRKVKTKISEVHKEAKAESRAFGLRLDTKKNEYTGEVDGMIAVHKDPLDTIEAEKQAIIDAEKKRLEREEERKQLDLEAREAAVKEREDKVAKEAALEERKEREKKIAEDAAETARVQTEQKAKAEAEAEELARIKVKERAEAAEKKRIENKKHRKKIEDEAHFGLTETGHLGDIEASEVLTAIMENRIPHVSINY